MSERKYIIFTIKKIMIAIKSMKYTTHDNSSCSLLDTHIKFPLNLFFTSQYTKKILLSLSRLMSLLLLYEKWLNSVVIISQIYCSHCISTAIITRHERRERKNLFHKSTWSQCEDITSLPANLYMWWWWQREEGKISERGMIIMMMIIIM